MQFGAAFQGQEHQAFFSQGTNSCAALVIHGFPGTPAEVLPVAHLFVDAGWTVHAPLLPGFGAQLDTLPNRTYHDWYTEVRSAYLQLSSTHKTVILVGFSMGGALAAALAAECSPSGLILCAPFWKFDAVLWRLLPILKYIFPRVKPFRLFKPDFNDPETRQGILKFMPGINLDDAAVQTAILNFEIPIGMIDSIRLAGQQAQKSMANIHCPTLVIQGLADELVQPSLTHQLIKALPVAPSYVEVDANHALFTPEQPHWSMIESQVMDFIQDFASKENNHS